MPSLHLLRRRASDLERGSSALLYAAIVCGSDALALCGVVLSPLMWQTNPATRRHLALVTSVLAVVLGPRFLAVDEGLALFQSRWAWIAIAPSFAFRPSMLPLLGLLAFRRRRVRLALALNVVVAGILFIAAQVSSLHRVGLETVGFLAFAAAAVVETVNAWYFWTEPDGQVARAPLVVAMTLACVTLALWVPPVVPRRGAEIRFWWPTAPMPEFGTVEQGYGWSRIGHTGEFPRLLERAGYRVTRRSDFDALHSRLLVLPLPFRPLKAGEVEGIRRYVVEGGRALVIGEHTSLDGVRDSVNPILAGTGLSLNFDTTNALFGDGTLALTGPHVAQNPYLTHNRGASLRLTTLRAVPLLVGSWWHSDYGDPLAPDHAYLSDYRLSPRDRIGRVVLAARVPLGRGEIVVWGDGSPFLNQNLVFNSRYLLDIVNDLAGEVRWRWLAPGLAVALLTLWVASARSEMIGITALVALLAPIVWSREAPMPQPLAVVSDSESNGFDRDAFSEKGVTGLGVWLTRAGYVAWLGDWKGLRTPPRLLFVLNPNRAITDGHVGRLRAIAESGATVVIAGGGDSQTFRAMAEKLQCQVVGAPIGSVSGTQFTTYSAWRLDCTQGTPLLAGDVPVGVVVAAGHGRIVIIADSGFFLSKNLETESQYDLKNQQFLETILFPQ